MTGIIATNYRAIGKGKVVASVDIEVEKWHIKIRCLIIEGSSGRFVSLPSESFTNRDGKKTYKPLVEIIDKVTSTRFQIAALAAIADLDVG